MTGGSSVETVTGATSSVIVAGSSGGAGLVRLTTTVCESSWGTAGVLSFAPSMTTSSQTMTLWPGPEFRGRGPCRRVSRVQYASWSPASDSSVLSPALTLTDDDGHVLPDGVGELQFVGQMHLAVGGGHGNRRREHARREAGWRRPAGHRSTAWPAARRTRTATWSRSAIEHAATRTAVPRSATRPRTLGCMRRSYGSDSGSRLGFGVGCGPLVLGRLGGVDGVGVGAELGGLVSCWLADRRVGIDVLLRAEHEEEHHPSDRGDEDPADQAVDQHRGDRRGQRHPAGDQTGHQHGLHDQQSAGHQRNRADRARRGVGHRQPGQRRACRLRRTRRRPGMPRRRPS